MENGRSSSAGYLEGYHRRPRIDHDLMSRHAEGIIVLSGCLSGTICSRLADEDLAGVARVMAEHSIRAVPVVEDDKLVGLLSRSDLLHALPSDVHPFSVEFQAGKQVGVRVAQAMSRDVVTVRPDDPVDVAVAEMDERRLSCVVVAGA